MRWAPADPYLGSVGHLLGRGDLGLLVHHYLSDRHVWVLFLCLFDGLSKSLVVWKQYHSIPPGGGREQEGRVGGIGEGEMERTGSATEEMRTAQRRKNNSKRDDPENIKKMKSYKKMCSRMIRGQI